MSYGNINIRLHENTKKQFDTFCNRIGISPSAAIGLFISTALREQRIPFEIRANVPSTASLAAMNEVDCLKRDNIKCYAGVDPMMEEERNPHKK